MRPIQQAGDDGAVRLNFDAHGVLRQQVPTAEHMLEEPKEDFNRPAMLVFECLDGTISLVYRGRELAWEEITHREQPTLVVCGQPTSLGRIAQRPAANHLRKRPFKSPSPTAARPPWSASVATLPAQRKAGGKKKQDNALSGTT